MTAVFNRIAIVLAALCLLVLPAKAGPHVLVDASTGEVLSHEDAFQRWYPASLTKLMTAYVAFRAIDEGEVTLESPVRMSRAAAEQPPSKMYYGSGSVMSLDNALKMIIVKSANDVAVAIGESIAGSRDGHVARMNAEAARLGMTGTRFVNANGLHSTGQYSTARDLALLSLAIRREYPQYAHYFAIEAIDPGKEPFATYNILIGRFDGADGMKTGFVCASGFNMVASATRGGRTLVAVVLGALSQKARADIAANLLEDGFAGRLASQGALASLAAYGDNNDKARDMRGTVCTDKARASRWDGREVEGYITFESPYITALTRQPRAVKVGLGGATGPVSKSAPNLLGQADVPIPTPRPDRPGDVKADANATAGEPNVQSELRQTFDVPVPVSRDSVIQ